MTGGNYVQEDEAWSQDQTVRFPKKGKGMADFPLSWPLFMEVHHGTSWTQGP